MMNTYSLRNQPLLWTGVILLGLIGCVTITIAGSIWWWQQDTDQNDGEEAAVLETPTAMTEVTIDVASAPPTHTATLTPTIPPEPTATAELLESHDTLVGSSAGDNLRPATTGSSPASTSDTLSLSQNDTEGVILFLSSRDHDPDPETASSPTGPAQNRTVELYAMKPDGSEQIRLSDGQREWWNGNAQLTRYYKPNQIVINGKYVFDLTTGQVVDELILEFPNTNPDVPFLAQVPVWSADGEIFFDGNKWDERLSIYYLENIQGEPQRLTAPPDDVWGDGYPALSPDGEWIVFMRNWYDESQDGLWLMKSDGSEVHRIVAGKFDSFRRASWSPDGARLAIEGPKTNSSVTSHEIWVATIDGENLQQLTSFPADTRGAWGPQWSPDGQRIVFQSGIERGQIYVIDADGGTPQQLTTLGDANLAPLWLPLSFDELSVSGESATSALDSEETPTPAVAAFDPLPIDPPTVYFFYGDWCGYSQKAAVTVESVKAKYGNRIKLVQVDVDRNFHYDSEFNIKSVPTFIWVDGQGRVINYTSGVRPKSYFDEVYRTLVKNQDGQGPCTTSGIQVTWPPAEAIISDKTYVYGTIAIPNFQYYKLEYWAANGSDWAYLLEKQTPVDNGEIFMLDTETVPEGRYGLRITAVEQSGNYPEPCEIWWTIDN